MDDSVTDVPGAGGADVSGAADTFRSERVDDTFRGVPGAAIDPAPGIASTDPRRGDARHTHADVAKPGGILGDEPTVDIREGGRRFMKFRREHADW